MHEQYIEMLIDSIEKYDNIHKPPYFILFYIPSNEELEIYDEIYFAVLAAKVKPDEKIIQHAIFETKKRVGNMIFAADYKVLKKDEAINHLESILN